jgi:L-iditol 2-dehydrogenase
MMRAAFLADVGVVRVVDQPTPRPGPEDVILRVDANAICGSDLAAYRGVHSRIRPPTILGHEFAGTVVEFGTAVRSVALGRRVAAEPNIACGVCRYCRRGFPNVCVDYLVIGEDISRPGACAEYVKVPAGQLYPLPDHVSSAEGALVQPFAIAHRGVDRGQVRADQTVLIFGAGPIGLAAMRIARQRGARTIVVDVLPYRLDVARRLGADLVIDPGAQDLHATVLDATDGYGAEVSMEIAGGAQVQTFADACALTARQGRVVVVGSFKHDEAPFPIIRFKFRELDIVGSQGHPSTFGPTLELIADGSLPAAEMITHRFPLDRVADGFALLADRADGVMKVVIEP